MAAELVLPVPTGSVDLAEDMRPAHLPDIAETAAGVISFRVSEAGPDIARRLPDPVASLDGHTLESLTHRICAIPLATAWPRPLLAWVVVASLLTSLLFVAIGVLFVKGTGIWGINQPVSWGFDIINFVWWIGIGHAGTLISAILYLFRQEWRTSIHRFAETMTLAAALCAALFPLLHVGRPWLAYWLLPIPNTMQMFPQFQSPLIWDVFAVGTYLTVSFLFWYLGLLPDLASLRDRAGRVWVRKVYGVAALGWRGSARHWQRHKIAYLLMATLSTPLVVSVHTIVSLDFAVSLIPGWHTTIFPPYFVAGAIFSGFSMLLMLLIPVRALFGLHDLIGERHLNNMAKLMLVSGLIVAYGYAMEAYFAWYSGSPHEAAMMSHRVGGDQAWAYAVLLFCNTLVPQLLWSRAVRTGPVPLFLVSVTVSIGMWFERFIIVVGSLQKDFLPSSWVAYSPTFWDFALFLGTAGLFLLLMILFIRCLPMVSAYEMRELLHRKRSVRQPSETAR